MNFEKKTKALNYGMEFTHGIRRALMGALALIYFISLDYSVVAVTTLFAVSTIIMMFFEFPTGAIADYDSRKKSIVISLFLLSVAFFGLFIFENFWLLAASWILGDIAWTFSTGAGSAWLIDALGYAKEKSKLVNLVSRSYFFEKSGHIVGGLIGLIVVAINFRFIWLIVSLSNLAMMFIFILYAEERNFKPTKTPANYLKKSIIKAKESVSYVLHKKNKNLRILISTFFLGVIALGSFFISIPLFFTENLGLNPEYVSGLFAFTMFLSLMSPFLAEKIVHKKDFRISLFSIFLVMGISIIILGVFPSLIIALACFSILQICLTATDIIGDSALQYEFSSKIRASLGSLNSLNWSLAHSITVFFTGLGIEFFGIVTMLVVSGVLTMLTALIYLIGIKD